jgi:hypothetical protein
MIGREVQSALLVLVAATALAACHAREAAPAQGFMQYLGDLEDIGKAIATATGYPADHVYVTGSRTDLHISILDAGLMAADAPTLERAAGAVIVAAEPALAAHAEFDSVQVIRVGIHHPSGLAPPIRDWHAENVLEFRRGSNQRFAISGS